MNVNSRIDVPQQRMKASDFHPELLEIYDGYAHGLITKREFLERAQKFAVGGVTALALEIDVDPVRGGQHRSRTDGEGADRQPRRIVHAVDFLDAPPLH